MQLVKAPVYPPSSFVPLVTLPPVTGVLGSPLVTVLHNDFYSVPLATLMPRVPFMEVLHNGLSCLSRVRVCFFLSLHASQALS